MPESTSRVRAEMDAVRTAPGHSTAKSNRTASTESSTDDSSDEMIATTEDNFRSVRPSPAMRRMANALDAANNANIVNDTAITIKPKERKPSAASAILAMTGDSANFVLTSGLQASIAR